MILFLGYSLLFAVFDNRVLMTVWRYRLQRDAQNLNESQIRVKVFLY
jgi:hypothetical protein